MQAQDFLGALWALGVRTPGATEQSIERAIADRAIVRTWPMRGTLHFVAAEDIRWMLELLTPRVVARSAGRYRQLELDDALFSRARKVFERALGGGRQLARPVLYEHLRAAGIPTAGSRGLHILGHLAQQRVICFGPRAGKQATFALLDEWIPESKRLMREESLAEIALRYFASHGPATLQDFVWWSGLPVRDARAAIEMNRERLAHEQIGGTSHWLPERSLVKGGHGGGRGGRARAHLLPPFDEFVVAYRDRSAVIDERFARRTAAGGILKPVIVIDAHVIGTWSRTFGKNAVTVSIQPFGRLSGVDRSAIEAAVERYGSFLGRETVLEA